MNAVTQVGRRRLLLSPYPLTRAIIERIEATADPAETKSLCLGELKRNSPLQIVRELRLLGSEDLELWVVVSDHNYQPYLQILLALASILSARQYVICDYAGQRHATTRVGIWLTAPWKLLWGSIKGAVSLRAADVQSRTLLEQVRQPGGKLPAHPRVAYLKTNLWFGVQAGGSIGHVAGVVNGFARLGCAIDVFTAEALPLLDSAVAVTQVPIKAPGGIPLEINGYVFQQVFDRFVAANVGRAQPVDLVYQRNCLVNYSGVLLARRLGVPLVIEYNGSEVWISKNWGTPLRFGGVAQRIEDINLRHAHLIVVVSDVLRDELLERGVEPARILSYPNCIDPTIFDPQQFSAKQLSDLRARWGVPPAAVVCTFVGTFGPWHGVDVLALAIRKLADTRMDWLRQRKVHFVLVGDGQLMPKVRQLLQEVPQELYTFTGLVPQSEAPAYLAMSDVLLSPHVPNPDGSRFFGSPTKLFEYMAMGKPVVASELEQIGQVLEGSWHVGRQGLPGGADQLQGSVALLTQPGDVDELCVAVDYLVEHADERRLLGAAARDLALEKYTWEQQVRQILGKLQDSRV